MEHTKNQFIGGLQVGSCGEVGRDLYHTDKYTSSGYKLQPLKLVWNNPNKKQSRKKYWARLRLVWNGKRAA